MNEKFRFCPKCGSDKISFQIPPNDNLARNLCPSCQSCFYSNPNIIIGAVITWQNKYLLCKRNIHPRLGYWTFPAGFLENGETLEQGACRETYEESKADIEIERLLSIYSLTKMHQVHITYLAQMKTAHFSTTFESSEVKLFDKKDIPWENIAFPVTKWALKAAIDNKDSVDQRAISEGDDAL